MKKPWQSLGITPLWTFESGLGVAFVEGEQRADGLWAAFAFESATCQHTGLYEFFRGPYHSAESAWRNAVAFGCTALAGRGEVEVKKAIYRSVFPAFYDPQMSLGLEAP